MLRIGLSSISSALLAIIVLSCGKAMTVESTESYEQVKPADILVVFTSVLGVRDVKDLRDAYMFLTSRRTWGGSIYHSQCLWFVFPHPSIVSTVSFDERPTLDELNFLADAKGIVETGSHCIPVVSFAGGEGSYENVDDLYWHAMTSIPTVFDLQRGGSINAKYILFMSSQTIFVSDPIPIINTELKRMKSLERSLHLIIYDEEPNHTSTNDYFIASISRTAKQHNGTNISGSTSFFCEYNFVLFSANSVDWTHLTSEEATSSKWEGKREDGQSPAAGNDFSSKHGSRPKSRRRFCHWLHRTINDDTQRAQRKAVGMAVPVPLSLRYNFAAHDEFNRTKKLKGKHAEEREESVIDHLASATAAGFDFNQPETRSTRSFLFKNETNWREAGAGEQQQQQFPIALLRTTHTSGLEILLQQQPLTEEEQLLWESSRPPGDFAALRKFWISCYAKISGPVFYDTFMEDMVFDYLIYNLTNSEAMTVRCPEIFGFPYFAKLLDLGDIFNVSWNRNPEYHHNRILHRRRRNEETVGGRQGGSGDAFPNDEENVLPPPPEKFYSQPWFLITENVTSFPSGYSFEYMSSDAVRDVNNISECARFGNTSLPDYLGCSTKGTTDSLSRSATSLRSSITHTTHHTSIKSSDDAQRLLCAVYTSAFSSSEYARMALQQAKRLRKGWQRSTGSTVGSATVCGEKEPLLVLITDLPLCNTGTGIDGQGPGGNSASQGKYKDNTKEEEQQRQEQQLREELEVTFDRIVLIDDNFNVTLVLSSRKGKGNTESTSHSRNFSPSIIPSPITKSSDEDRNSGRTSQNQTRDSMSNSDSEAPSKYKPEPMPLSFINQGFLPHLLADVRVPSDSDVSDMLRSLDMDQFHHKPSLWLKRMLAMTLQPLGGARYVLFLDADLHPCNGDYLEVFNAIGNHDLLTFTDPTESFGGTNKVTEFPYPANYLTKEWTEFPERLMNFVLLDYKKKAIQDLVLKYVRTYVEELRDMMLGRYFVRGDQTAFREALFFFRNILLEKRIYAGSELMCNRPGRFIRGSCRFLQAFNSVEVCPSDDEYGTSPS